MYPVVVGGTLERLTREGWPAFFLLLETVLFPCPLHEFFLQPLLLSLPVRLLLVGNLGWFVEIRLVGALGTQYALVVVGHALFLVVLTRVTEPFADLAIFLNPVAGLVHIHPTSSAFQPCAFELPADCTR
jgi:hypothetical protein